MKPHNTINKKKIIRSTLLNIDSTYRNTNPKNIFKTNGKILPNNPFSLVQNSSIITVNYPNHNLLLGDNILIQNVNGNIKLLANSFYLLNSFQYLIYISPDNNIPVDYKKYVNTIHVNIEIYSDQTETNMINNIPINGILGIKKILTVSDIPTVLINNTNFLPIIQDYNTTNNTNVTINNLLFVELLSEYINQQNIFYKLNQVFKISNLHINGIDLGYLNSNYPINNYNYQSHQEIINVIDMHTFQINIASLSYADGIGGGKLVQVMKIIDSVTGYPEINSYTVNLKKAFNNVTKIELISTEFPYIDLTIKKNINDKLYWKNLQDGPTVYNIKIDEGVYSTVELLNKINTKLNLTPRSISSSINIIYNIFDVIFEANTQTISFTAFNIDKLPNSMSIREETIDQNIFYVLTVSHKNNVINSGDAIIISGAGDVTINTNLKQIYSVANSYINGTLIIYSVDLNNQTYDIILGQKKEIFIQIVGLESSGGENIVIKSNTKISFLFDRPDTIGSVIGFNNVGSIYSVTEFNSTVTNKDSYVSVSVNNYNSIGNELTYLTGYNNLSGNYNYFLMYINDIEYVYSNNATPSAFAKILLTGNPGDVLFNTFVPHQAELYSKVFPISTLTYLTISFLYPDGAKIDFRNINHSFTLKIIEEIFNNEETYLSSNKISFSEEIVKNNKFIK